MDNYREIIKWNIRKAIKKRDSAETRKEAEYWNKIIAILIADLRDYEEQEIWRRKLVLTPDEIIRKFFEEWK